MPNDFIDVRGFANKNENDLTDLLSVLAAVKGGDNPLTSQENRLNSVFRGQSDPSAKANFIKTLGQDLRNQQPYREQEVIEDTRIGNRDVPTTVTKAAPPKPHTDTSSMDSLFALLALLNGPGMAMKLPAFAKALGLTTPRGIATNAATYFGMPYAMDKIQQGVNASRDYLSDPANPLARGLEMLSKNPPTPR